MPYLNLDPDYFDHPKTLRLVGLLGKGSAELPLRLWCKVGKHHAQDGRLAGYSAQEIESLVLWWGQPGKCVEAMVKVGFLEAAGDGFAVHQWTDHQGHVYSLQVRAKKAARAKWDRLRADAKQCLRDAPQMDRSSSCSEVVKAVSVAVTSKAAVQPTTPATYGLGMPFSREFLAFWDAYPRKMKQAAANRAWEELRPGPELVIEIMGALAQHRVAWTGKDPEFIPFAANWLIERRWLDKLDDVPLAPAKPPRCHRCNVGGLDYRPTQLSQDGKTMICRQCKDEEEVNG